MAEVTATLDALALRSAFPVLAQKINGQPLVYFDNAASSQKPDAVVNAISNYYRTDHANIHRGVHQLAQRATAAYESARDRIARYLNIEDRACLLFTAGTTDSVNTVAHTWGRTQIKAGDIILVSALEHHSNLVPWQMVAQEKGANIEVIPIDDRGVLDLGIYKQLLEKSPKLVAVNHVSNSLGTINPIKQMTEMAHAAGAVIFVDGAQAAPHMSLNLTDLGCDFYALSGHKVYGPTGVGILYGRRALLETMPPWRGGGEMIATVSYTSATWNELPYKFEAGTPNMAGVIGLGAAFDWVDSIGVENIAAHETLLTERLTSALLRIDGITIYGLAPEKAGVVSFLADDVHPYDLGTLLDQMGMAVRTGHHCTQPLMDLLGIPGTVRASFAAYNTIDEVDRFVVALQRALTMLR